MNLFRRCCLAIRRTIEHCSFFVCFFSCFLGCFMVFTLFFAELLFWLLVLWFFAPVIFVYDKRNNSKLLYIKFIIIMTLTLIRLGCDFSYAKTFTFYHSSSFHDFFFIFNFFFHYYSHFCSLFERELRFKRA